MPFADDLPASTSTPGEDSFGGGVATADQPAINGRATWGDVGQGLIAGAHSTAAAGAGALSAVQEPGGPHEATQGFALQQEQAAREAEQGMTPAGRRPGFFSHPLVSTAEALPGIAAIAAPAAVAGPFAPAVVGGMMGVQTLGEAQNRATEQGYELTPGQKLTQFGIGAATGIVPEIGLPAKVATTPLVQKALGVAESAVTFGASTATSEAASQQTEIGAGKRSEYDVPAIVSAGETGAEQGAAFGAAAGVSGHPTRSAREYPKPEVGKEATPVTPQSNVEVMKGPVGSTEAAALAAKPITPESKVQPEVVQTQPVKPTEAQGQANTTEPVLPPQPEARPQPLPRAESPVTVPEVRQPETAETLAAQHAALLDPNDPREAMLYAKGQQPIEIVDKTSFGQVKLPDGSIVQYDKNGPSGLTAAKIRQYAKDDRLNEALQLGPVTKDEALDQTRQGEQAAVVTERTPDGTPVKDAAGTTATAPEQLAALEATKGAGNTLEVRPPEDVIGERQAGVAQEQVVQPEVAITPESKPLAGRTLEDISTGGQAARDAAVMASAEQARTVADQLKAKEAAKQPPVPARSHKGKKVDEAKAQAKSKAAEIVAAHPAKELGHDWTNELYAHAEAISNAATKAAIKVPQVFKEGESYDPALLKIREARDLITNEKGERVLHPSKDKFNTFYLREKLIDAGRHEEALAMRRSEGDQGLGSGGMKKADVEALPNPASHELEKPEDVKAPAEREAVTETPAEHVASSREDDGELAVRERPPVVKEVEEGKHFTAGKTAVGFQVSKAKSRAIKRQAMEDEGGGKVLASDSKGNPIELSPTRSTTLRDAVVEHFDPKRYSPELRPMMERLRDAVLKLAGDTDVHYVSHDELTRAAGEQAHGMYDPQHDHVLLNADNVRPDTALHEAFHAATTRALEESPELQKLMDRLQKEMGVKGDSEEFLTRLMTEDKMQQQFKAAKISPELAQAIGIPKWRKATMWEGALNIIRNALGLGPRDVSAIEAAMGISERAMWKRDPGMAMEASARLGAAEGRLRLQKMEPAERDQEAFLRHPMDVLKGVKDIEKSIAVQHAKDIASNAGKSLIGLTAKVLSGTQIRDIHGKLFDDAKGNIIEAINRARDKVAQTYNTARTADRDTINRGYLLDKQFRSQMADYAELVNLSSRFNIHADREAPKASKARENIQRDANYGKARELYNRLDPELQKRYSTEKKFYQDKQKELAETVLDKTLPLLDLPKDMEKRARANDLTDADWDHLKDIKVDGIFRKAYRLLGKNDVYFNAQRSGDFTFTGKYAMPKGGKDVSYSGEQLKDNQREFATEDEARKYAADTHMPATVRERTYWTDPATGKVERKSGDEAASSGKIDKRYEVTLERQHTEMHDTHAEAVKARAEAEKAGVGELSGVLDRTKESSWSTIGAGDQAALERRIKSRDDLNPAEKDHLINSTRQLTAGTSGMAPHLLKSRKVAGADFSTGQGLDSYSRAINQHIARNAHSTELQQAMTRLQEHEDATRGDMATSYRRSVIGNEMRDRVYRDPNVGVPKSSPLLHKLMTLSFIDFLVRPSHVFLSQVHPYIYSVPMMAGRHGYWKAIQAQHQAMRDLGGQLANLGRGAKAGADIVKSLREKDSDKAVALAHGGDPIHEMINRLTDKNERAALLKMYETGHLHSAYDTSMFTGGGLDRTNATMQQFTNAMEANNRLSTALAAYRLEKGMHDDTAALQYARRVIEETHGVYSQSNIAPIFKNPLLRATLQFHQQPMNLAIMLYRNMYKAAHGDKEAMSTMAYQLGTAAMLGGMGGMPLDLPKLAGIATSPVTGAMPSDWNDRTRRMFADTFGAEIADGVMDGIPGLMGPLGPSLGHRMGFDAGLLNDEPKSGKSSDVMAWVAKNLAGAPGGVLMDWLDAGAALEQGDYQKMSEKALPGSLKDLAKAYREATIGKVVGGHTIRGASYGDALLQTFGFSGVEAQRQMEGHYAMQKAIQEASAAKKQTVGEKLKQAQRDRAAKGRPSVLGTPITKTNRAIAKEYGRVYQ